MTVALRTEGVDRNDHTPGVDGAVVRSPSARRAWIEIASYAPLQKQVDVALRTEGVDRNFSNVLRSSYPVPVALRTEGVDRNIKIPGTSDQNFVALRTEGVDRNPDCTWDGVTSAESPSARRAWIEIFRTCCAARTRCRSPSARRAWIEI